MIPGKDADLDETIQRATSCLLAAGLCVEPLSWLHPAPQCWSVHLADVTHPYLTSNGKGRTKKAAMASGLAEFLERLATNFYFSDYYLDELEQPSSFLFFPNEKWLPEKQFTTKGKEVLLSPELWDFYDCHGELTFDLLCDHNTDSRRRAISSLPFRQMDTDQLIYFPTSLLNNLYLSNGMAAGNSAAEATAQALSEIIERYVKNQVISGGLKLPDIPGSRLSQLPHLLSVIATLEKQGFAIRVKDASLGGRFPVVCVLLLDASGGGAYCAFGANLRFAVACERIMTELLQGRKLSALRNFSQPVVNLEEAADPFNLETHFIDSTGLLPWRIFSDEAEYPYCPWDFSGSTTQECEHLLRLVTDLGFKGYRAEYRQHSFYTCRILVPRMSEIYPLDDLIYNNRNTASPLRTSLLNLQDKDARELELILAQLDTPDLHDQQRVAELINIRFASDSPYHSLTVGELRALLLLALGNHEEASFWCSWCADHGRLADNRVRLFRLLHILLSVTIAENSWQPYMNSLRHCFTTGELHTATETIACRLRFPGLNSGGRWRDISPAHAHLLSLYETLLDHKSALHPKETIS